ncbi:DNA mismatch repair protein MLH3 isoform X1 [Salvia hispanica]|uniref:DNA mismatch repair protein MLH3 isoform X1 n=3 Tax=Salvia hispanica TaxID=49212 RepID=UPI0020092763|nr:DNA mismatch repair protein MLH3 isoform X1 [Salvia hispanica]XP_047973391.1 DNA mismatch repair protein MLH3 isoform X1 [Salvia hispanica]
MRSIERLPETTHSSVRSGVVICDLTRIVEELVFNSLDAGATEVAVSVGVGSSYLKVVDNGSGITRDGLLLLGERYVTSKVDYLALDASTTENLDYHGEALCSISDVSLLEIVTKARGKSTGYKKILKKRKCVFIGINNDREEVGTTVISHDIFYNQPVRRKQMQSSPKKVLDSIKMSVLRTALVHVNVFFRVVDVESLDELLCVGPSASPLPILSTYFGIGSSASFHKLVLSNRELNLSGYISEPHGIFSPKAIQYVYINSRLVYKGPIHKLVNQLAAKFDMSSPWQLTTSSQRMKQNKYDKCPAFILNLQCPTSYYDIIASERLRTSVEFKDWAPVLTFIEDGVMRLWTKNTSHDMLGNPESGKRRCQTQTSLVPVDVCSTHWDKPYENHDNSLGLEETTFESGKSCRKVLGFENFELEADLLPENDYISQACDGSMVGETINQISPWCVSSPLHVAKTYGRKMDDLSSALGYILPATNENVDSRSIASGASIDCHYFGDNRHTDEEYGISFLRSCSFDKSLMKERRSPSKDARFEFGRDGRAKRRRIDCCDIVEDDINSVMLGGDVECSALQPFQFSPVTRHDIDGMLESPGRDSVKSSFLGDNLPDSEQFWESTSSWHSFRSGWSPLTRKETEIKFLDNSNYPIEKTSVEGHSGLGKDILHRCPIQGEILGDTKYNRLQQDCSFTNHSPDEEIGESQLDFENLFSLKPFKRFTDAYWSLSPVHCEESLKNFTEAPSDDTSPDECEHGMHNCTNQGTLLNKKMCFSKSHPAPPYYSTKRGFLDLTDTTSLSAIKSPESIFGRYSSIAAGEFSNEQLHVEDMSFKCSDKPDGQFYLSPRGKQVMDCTASKRSVLEIKPESTSVQKKGKKEEEFTNIEPVESLGSKEIEDSLDSRWKWRNCSLATAGNSSSDIKRNQDGILNIFSDSLQLDGVSLVPKSVERACLENAKVLDQVDKKFIAIVAGKTLAIIDQHAADERIKLEELRSKVLSGEMKTIKYLDSEHELVLPEIGYQLLHNYAEQIQTWGWICNIHSQDSNSFTKHLDSLHRQPTVIKLLAVPCILGVVLNDIDLLEFLQQLADTDGSSTIPPSVHRVLNSKACRGAIMFGDTLLPSECSLIVDELKQTSLCFQCAHGRPTTVPLVNLEILHNKVARLGIDASCWHGLRQHKVSLKRMSQRLRSAVS